MKIQGQLKEKLDKAMDKAVALCNPHKIKVIPPSVRWRILHLALTSPKCAAQNKLWPNKKLMDEVYRTCNDDHLKTYMNNYFKN